MGFEKAEVNCLLTGKGLNVPTVSISGLILKMTFQQQFKVEESGLLMCNVDFSG